MTDATTVALGEVAYRSSMIEKGFAEPADTVALIAAARTLAREIHRLRAVEMRLSFLEADLQWYKQSYREEVSR